MSYVTLTVRDGARSVHGQVHGSTADRLVAALSAEPETIEELEAAFRRWERIDNGYSVLTRMSRGDCEEPYDAGVVIIDLAARFVAYESSYSTLSAEGSENFHNGQCATDKWFNFQLPSDWRIESSMMGWESIAARRRTERMEIPPLDWRVVAYDTICGEIAGECCRMWQAGVRRDGAAADDYVAFEAVRVAIRTAHAKWLLTVRDDLRGLSPRELFFAHRNRIDLDLQWRGNQWSVLGFCPPGLSRESHAFRFGGAGTHEWVLHYEMVRHLFWESWERISSFGAVGERVDPSAEAARLRSVRDEWLDAPQFEELSGRTPRDAIDRERMRLPEGVTGREAHVDCNCPICEMMLDDPGPYFWHLDGCNMDDEFAFSYHATLEEYEQQQRKWAEFNAKFERERAEREALGLNEGNEPWSRSWVNWELLDDEQAGRFNVFTLLFGVGCQLAELNGDLRQADPADPFAARLSRNFGNLRAALSDRVPALIEPVLDCFRESLLDTAAARPEAAAKCESLARTLARVTRRLDDEDGLDDDSPRYEGPPSDDMLANGSDNADNVFRDRERWGRDDVPF